MREGSDQSPIVPAAAEAVVGVAYDGRANIALISVPSGVSFATLINLYDECWRPHPDFREDASVILDLSAVAVVPDEARQAIRVGLRKVSVYNADVGFAYVTPSDLGFGFMRMFVTQADYLNPSRRGAFRSVEGARAWLLEGGDPL